MTASLLSRWSGTCGRQHSHRARPVL